MLPIMTNRPESRAGPSPHARALGSGVGDILTLFRRNSPLTRAAIARETGLSRATVNQRLDALITAGLLVPAGEEAPTRGRPAGHFAFNADRGVLLVADMGATAMRTALCDLSGTTLEEQSETADITEGPEAILSVAQALFEKMLSATNRDAGEVHGIGLSVPGPVDIDTGRPISPPIMTGWDRYDVPGWFGQHYTCPVLVDKDCNAMALGESRAVYPEVANLLFLKVGTGVGSGIIANGQSYRGADGAAGDIGHNELAIHNGDEAPLCRCGNTGCVEAYAGGWALVRDLRAENRDILTVDEAVGLIRAGDQAAVRLTRRAGRILGTALADAVSLLNPRVIVVGGQLARAEEQLFAGMREMIYRRSLPLATRHLLIVPTRLDQRAGVVGLTLLVADRIFAADRIEAMVGSSSL
jgi:predicted NBD/HSP70 family sugar kinase